MVCKRNAWQELLIAYTEQRAQQKCKELESMHAISVGRKSSDNLNSKFSDKARIQRNQIVESRIEDNTPVREKNVKKFISLSKEFFFSIATLFTLLDAARLHYKWCIASKCYC